MQQCLHIRIARPHLCSPGVPTLDLGRLSLLALQYPKSRDLHKWPRRGIQQRVLQLDVPVHHPHPVAVVQPHYELLEEPPCIILLRTIAQADLRTPSMYNSIDLLITL